MGLCYDFKEIRLKNFKIVSFEYKKLVNLFVRMNVDIYLCTVFEKRKTHTMTFNALNLTLIQRLIILLGAGGQG